MSEVSAAPPANGRSTFWYRSNAALFAVLMVALTFWFERHLEVYVTQIALVGGTMTLWAVWQLLQSWLKWGFDTDAKGQAKKLFARREGMEYLIFGAVILVILFVSTSSLYISYEGTAGGTEFRVEVDSRGQRLLPPLQFNSSQKIAGQPYFLQFRSQQLELRVLEPRGYDPLPATLRPGGRLDIKVPRDFKPKKFHVLRIVPGSYLYSNLPEYSDYPSVQYQVKVTRNGVDIGLFQDLRRQSLYLGSSADDIQWLLGKQQQGESFRSLTEAMQSAKISADSIAQLVPSLERDSAFLSTPEFAPGDEVKLQITRRKEGAIAAVAAQTIHISDKDTPIRPVLLEIPPGANQ